MGTRGDGLEAEFRLLTDEHASMRHEAIIVHSEGLTSASLSPARDKSRGSGRQNKPNFEIGRTWPRGKHKHTRPVIMCEYAHAMGNSTGNLDDYWDIIRSTKGLQVRRATLLASPRAQVEPGAY